MPSKESIDVFLIATPEDLLEEYLEFKGKLEAFTEYGINVHEFSKANKSKLREIINSYQLLVIFSETLTTRLDNGFGDERDVIKTRLEELKKVGDSTNKQKVTVIRLNDDEHTCPQVLQGIEDVKTFHGVNDFDSLVNVRLKPSLHS